MRHYRARIVTALSSRALTGELAVLDDGVMSVDREGRITHLGPATPSSLPGLVLDLRPHVLVPGFVDTHLHFPQTRVVGGATGPLLTWLEESVFPEEARFRDERYARAVADEFVTRMLERGTTTSCSFSSSSPEATRVLCEALRDRGVRAKTGLVLMDERCPLALRVDARDAVRAMRELARDFHGHDGGRLELVVTPRFALSCSRELLVAAAEVARDLDLFVQTHVSEHPDEERATLAVHDFASDYLGVYEAVGLAGDKTLLAHAIHLSASEWDRLAERGVRVAHCPDSNFFLGSGRMPLGEARRRGVRVGLGTDVAAGRSFDVRETASRAYDSALCLAGPRGDRADVPSAAELFRMATLEGARALGLDAVTGSLEPGKEADFAVVAVPEHVRAAADLVGQLVFARDLTPVVATYVRGRAVWRAREHAPCARGADDEAGPS